MKEIVSNVHVGPMEDSMKPGWDVVINVDDAFPRNPEPEGARLFWIPINEVSFWGYQPFFAVKRILDHYVPLNKKILVHCSAGQHRSPIMVHGWMISSGFSEELIKKHLGEHAIRTFSFSQS